MGTHHRYYTARFGNKNCDFTQKSKSGWTIDIPNEVMMYIANQIDTNIRELEGALIRVVAYSSLVNSDITMDLAADALKDIIPNDTSTYCYNIGYSKNSW